MNYFKQIRQTGNKLNLRNKLTLLLIVEAIWPVVVAIASIVSITQRDLVKTLQ